MPLPGRLKKVPEGEWKIHPREKHDPCREMNFSRMGKIN